MVVCPSFVSNCIKACYSFYGKTCYEGLDEIIGKLEHHFHFRLPNCEVARYFTKLRDLDLPQASVAEATSSDAGEDHDHAAFLNNIKTFHENLLKNSQDDHAKCK